MPHGYTKSDEKVLILNIVSTVLIFLLAFLVQHKIVQMQHSSYSLDLVLCNFFLFPELKEIQLHIISKVSVVLWLISLFKCISVYLMQNAFL